MLESGGEPLHSKLALWVCGVRRMMRGCVPVVTTVSAMVCGLSRNGFCQANAQNNCYSEDYNKALHVHFLPEGISPTKWIEAYGDGKRIRKISNVVDCVKRRGGSEFSRSIRRRAASGSGERISRRSATGTCGSPRFGEQ
jgi:hypothetical protein